MPLEAVGRGGHYVVDLCTPPAAGTFEGDVDDECALKTEEIRVYAIQETELDPDCADPVPEEPPGCCREETELEPDCVDLAPKELPRGCREAAREQSNGEEDEELLPAPQTWAQRDRRRAVTELKAMTQRPPLGMTLLEVGRGIGVAAEARSMGFMSDGALDRNWLGPDHQ